jgi:hypothetical protein
MSQPWPPDRPDDPRTRPVYDDTGRLVGHTGEEPRRETWREAVRSVIWYYVICGILLTCAVCGFAYLSWSE